MSDDEYRPVTQYKLMAYPCGLKAGDRLELVRQIDIQDHNGGLAGQYHKAGEIWIVLPGVERQPNVIWLRKPDGERQTWDETIFDWFKKSASGQSGLEADP